MLNSLVFGLLFSIQTAVPSPAYDFWVAPPPAGSDSNPGTQPAPWATIGKARDYIRANPSLTNYDITVNISDGTYVLTSPLAFTTNDSGRNGHYIIYKALNGPGTTNAVNLVGCADKNGWVVSGTSGISTNIWKIAVGTNKTILTIYENGVRGRLARSPDYIANARYPLAQAPYKLSVTGGCDSVTGWDWMEYNSGDFSISNFTSTAKVTWWTAGGYCDWSMAFPALFSNDVTTRKLYFTSTPQFMPGGNMKKCSDRYFLAGIYSLLNQPGEFYYSTMDGWLYYYPRTAGNPDTQDMRVPLSDFSTLIQVGGVSGTNAHHIKFDGLTLAYTSYGLYSRGAIHISNTDHIEVRNCHILNVGRTAIYMSTANVSNLVSACWIEHCGIGGIVVHNPLLRADYPNDKSEFNVISNCKINDLGEVYIDGVLTTGVILWNTSDCEVSYCDIYNSGRYAISLRGHWGSTPPANNDRGTHVAKNNTFKYIRATDCMQDSGDGAIMHAASVNGIADTNGYENINYWNQILISGGYSDPSVCDWAPNGIFFDYNYCCQYQNLSNIQIDWVKAQNDTNFPSNTGFYRGLAGNSITNQTTTNLSFYGTFDEGLMDYTRIGLKPDFPFVYDNQDVVISDDRTLDYTESGALWGETTIPGLSKGDGRYNHSQSGSQFARWLPTFPFTRNYEVSIWKMGNHEAASSNAPYTIYYQEGSAEVTVNQQTGTTGEWVSVGVYPFAAGRSAANGAVKLFANPADGLAVRADAVKFTEAGFLASGVLGGEKGWWGFDNTNTDASGYNHTAVEYSAYSQIKVVGTHSAYLNGTNAYFRMADHQDLDIGKGDFAISLWFCRDSNPTNNLRLLSKGGGTDIEKGYSLYGGNTGINFALSSGDAAKPRRFLSGTHSGTNVWNHLAVNISRTGYMTLYINGVKTDEENISDWKDLDLSNSYDLYIGCSSAKTLYWPGRVDNLAVFQRVLSESEIGF